MGLLGIELGPETVIPFTETVVSLGEVRDRTLPWKPYLDNLSKKVTRVMYPLRFFRSCTTESLHRRLIQSLIFPLMDYCSTIMIDATMEQKIRLQRLQNTCVRYICGVKRTHHVTLFRSKLGWLRTDTRWQYFTAVLLYKTLNFQTPSYIREMLRKSQSNRPIRGVTKDLKVPIVHTNYGQRPFRLQGAPLWNSLPECIKLLFD